MPVINVITRSLALTWPLVAAKVLEVDSWNDRTMMIEHEEGGNSDMMMVMNGMNLVEESRNPPRHLVATSRLKQLDNRKNNNSI
jgi:hypothetical protein